MVIRTFFDKNNTIVRNEVVNTARNPVTELFYGGPTGENKYSRYLFHFDETRLVNMYDNGTFTDLTKLKHTLKLTNTASFDEGLLNGSYQSKERACSFDLIVFKVGQDWDEGVGYDYLSCNLLTGDCAISTKPSTWVNPQTGIVWTGGSGVYSGSPSGITIATQHFDLGNENLEVDITDYVNGVMTGNTNNGLGIAYALPYELTSTQNMQYVGFFTKYTQTFYEPYIETVYSNYITDDRNNFFLDKPNKLYLYVNVAGNPTNLDNLPAVSILDENGIAYSFIESSGVTHVTKGVYSVDLTIPSGDGEIGTLFNDVWQDLVINGVSRPDANLYFELKDSFGYYNLGDSDSLPKKVAVSISGVRNQEKIKRGDTRKVIVSTRIPYTIEQTQNISNIKYRIYVTEGKNELTVVDFQPVELASNYNYFLLDTLSLIPNVYYLDMLVESNLEVTTLKNVLNFTIVSESNLRQSQ
jgi:hypothetical protein